MITLAEVGSASNAQLGQWMVITFAVINGAVGIVGIISLFATRREVDKIDQRVTDLEKTDTAIRQENHTMMIELIANGEKRSTSLHRRLDPMVENLAATKVGQEAFVKSFDNFTEVMKAMAAGKRAHNPMEDI